MPKRAEDEGGGCGWSRVVEESVVEDIERRRRHKVWAWLAIVRTLAFAQSEVQPWRGWNRTGT